MTALEWLAGGVAGYTIELLAHAGKEFCADNLRLAFRVGMRIAMEAADTFMAMAPSKFSALQSDAAGLPFERYPVPAVLLDGEVVPVPEDATTAHEAALYCVKVVQAYIAILETWEDQAALASLTERNPILAMRLGPLYPSDAS
ncbi:hypothetical protein [Demequina iriomotensis]|uniref:hypothetical protein n=1 Tax=Demequina iriomotensis TaxID=1536641 RepID=UPI0012E04D9E|nr:hypothetical protein [Demequina iriomotensis]